ncbi:MAG: DNA polymerase III subunit beta [Myxococcota bacterium]|nr:DNA polymerase III subunit beta [Myxococcota bacterium]
MRFRIARDDFSQILSRLQGFLSKQALREEIMNGLLLEATEDQHLRLSATDLELFFRGEIPAEVEAAGSLIVDGRQLRGITRELPEQLVVFETLSGGEEEGEQLQISSGRSRMQLKTRPGELYPMLPVQLDESKMSEAAAEQLTLVLERTLFSASSEESRPNLNGLFLTRGEDPGAIRAVSTDGHRLSVVERAVLSGAGAAESLAETGMIVPKKAALELKKLLDGESPLSIAQDGNYLALSASDFQVAVRLVDAKFPDYKRVIPKENPLSYRLSRESLAAALKRICLVHHEVVLSFEAGQRLTLSSEAEQNSAEEEINLSEGSNAETMKIKFNAKFIQDILSIMGGDEVEFLLKNEELPGIIRELTPDAARDTFVIMPMIL